MKGAREYAKLFKTGQHGKLYLVSSSHARGLTFRIYVMPEGVDAIPNGSGNAPLNSDAVEVYGAVSGQLGWTETYGWIHKGKWVDDFNDLVEKRKAELDKNNSAIEKDKQDREFDRETRTLHLLSNY